jgi:hypothetical protein
MTMMFFGLYTVSDLARAEDNERLKKERKEKFESIYGKTCSIAPLNNQQLTGEQPDRTL